MIKELKYNFEMLIKGTLLIATLLLLGIVTYVLQGSFKEGTLSTFLQTPYADTLIMRYFLLTTYFVVLMFTYFVLADTTMSEKSGGRIEYLLSNGFNPQSYFWGSTIAACISNEIMILFIFTEFYIFRFFYFPDIPMIGLVKSLISISIFNLGISSLSCATVLKIRNVRLIGLFLFLFPYVLIFAGDNLITKIKPEYNNILLLATSVIGIVLFVISLIIARKLDNESIVLTIPG